jgi:hypothetical protein
MWVLFPRAPFQQPYRERSIHFRVLIGLVGCAPAAQDVRSEMLFKQRCKRWDTAHRVVVQVADLAAYDIVRWNIDDGAVVVYEQFDLTIVLAEHEGDRPKGLRLQRLGLIGDDPMVECHYLGW